MGAAQSQAKDITVVSKSFLDANKQYKALIKRVRSAPGFPVKNPTQSYWAETPPWQELVDMSMDLPSNRVEVVIIGSGITAAAVAYSYLQETTRLHDDSRVLVLESRDLCSGATGRCGGHLKVTVHEQFDDLKRRYNKDKAIKIIRFQLQQIEILIELCQANRWEIAECREVETVDFFLTEEERDAAFLKVKECLRHMPEVLIEMWGAEDAQQKFGGGKDVKGAVSYPAGAMDPYRFVSCVWDYLLEKHRQTLYIKTHATVLDIETPRSKNYAFEVTTQHATYRCDHVVHATNAWATEHVPGLRGRMTGLLGTMVQLRPGSQFPNVNGKKSWYFLYGQAVDYAVQRPSALGRAGDVVLGGGFSRADGQGASAMGVWDDSRVDALTVAHLRGILPTAFKPVWSAGWTFKKSWSGILALTGDLLPFAGRLDPELTGRMPDRRYHRFAPREYLPPPGEWISAGYCGDGLTWAWLCGVGIGVMLAGSARFDVEQMPGRPAGPLRTWFPWELEPTVRRVRRAGLASLGRRFF
ncbi:FAD dependent oxidoreductase-domain-containing protein [Jackrogersella minutella]|nr:FAD dependent oxidoreductase-domain-containing protein [Jackrogersella minutella]